MACFITPLVVGIVVGVVNRASKSLGGNLELKALAYMLIGGSLVLAAEHAWHGEIAPYPPFLTAMQSSTSISTLLHEVSVVGGFMTLLVVSLWLGALTLSGRVKVRAKTATRITTTLS